MTKFYIDPCGKGKFAVRLAGFVAPSAVCAGEDAAGARAYALDPEAKVFIEREDCEFGRGQEVARG